MPVANVELLIRAFDTLQMIQHELLLFAAFWFIIGAVDEVAIDLNWLALRLGGKANSIHLPKGIEQESLKGRAAILVPAWHEAEVLGSMIRHTLSAWQQSDFCLYIGCYRNDPETLAAAMDGANGDARVRIIVHEAQGPTTKADCLNRLYAALCRDEAQTGVPYFSVMLQDAEDMVHPAALVVIDKALAHADFVQLPVRPEPQTESRWIAGHYGDEFAESHAKAMVVRDRLGAALPAAGVGCAFSRGALFTLCDSRSQEGANGPFAAECLTEDYELGLLLSSNGSQGRFLRLRDHTGALVATRSYFPITLEEAVRQKTRWVHGIALQGWDRMGWSLNPVELWMAFRDRRGPLTALVLSIAYALVLIEALLGAGRIAGLVELLPISGTLHIMLTISVCAFLWRLMFRFAFTAREYGIAEGFYACLRIPLSNLIAILSGRRALLAYMRSLRSGRVVWDKTTHRAHPAMERATVMRAAASPA